MMPAVVVDVGNSRIKWGLCDANGVQETCALPAEDAVAWQQQCDRWHLPTSTLWAVTGVHPTHRDHLAAWLRERGYGVRIVNDWRQLPLQVSLPRPDYVGMDRLFDAVAANCRRSPRRAAVIIDAGSAVTVDYVDENGVFGGGAIFPGWRLMAQALHDHTALLPLVEPPTRIPTLPAANTQAAVEAGIFWAVLGGIHALLDAYHATATAPEVFLTGGDAATLHEVLRPRVAYYWPGMTLEGIRLSAAAMTE